MVEVDFRDFFGSLDSDFLLGLMARRISDRRVLRLIRQWMSAGVMEDGVTVSASTGVPQGGSISPLLSNVYGHALDALWAKEARHLGSIVRYADDAVLLCRSEADAQRAYRWLQGTAQALKLSLHPDKTRIVDLREGADGFDFLGFHHRMVKSWRYGKWYCQRWPSGRAMASIRAKVKEITAPRSRLKWPIGDLVAELNPVLRGWGNYFRWGNSARKFSQIDDYVRERLALFDSKKRQKPGRRWGEVHTYARTVRLGIHRLSGSVRYIPTCDSDQVNTVGEPCAREPHAQFDEGRLARRLAEPAAYSTTARCRGRENPPTGQGILLGARDLRDRRDADEIGEQDFQAELAGLQEHAR